LWWPTRGSGGVGVLVARRWSGLAAPSCYCTLTTIGHDRAGELVGFTAAHCGDLGSPVVAEGAENRGSLGTVVAAGEHLDYSVMTFDPAKATPIANCDDFVINGIGPGNDESHQPGCKPGWCHRLHLNLDNVFPRSGCGYELARALSAWRWRRPGHLR